MILGPLGRRLHMTQALYLLVDAWYVEKYTRLNLLSAFTQFFSCITGM